jgi:hypothetical protein
MIYVFALTIPANTSEANRLKFLLPVTAGKVIRGMVEFPSGHCGLTHLRICRGLVQLWPTNPDAQFKSSNETIDWEEAYELSTPPFEFQAYAWNDDDTYAHTITIRLVIESTPAEQNLVAQIEALLAGS